MIKRVVHMYTFGNMLARQYVIHHESNNAVRQRKFLSVRVHVDIYNM